MEYNIKFTLQCQKEQTSLYKINKYKEYNVQHDYS